MNKTSRRLSKSSLRVYPGSLWKGDTERCWGRISVVLKPLWGESGGGKSLDQDLRLNGQIGPLWGGEEFMGWGCKGLPADAANPVDGMNMAERR